MIEDDLNPQRKKAPLKNLGPLSVPDLKDYVQSLHEEIARAEEEIAKKQKHLSAADAFFKKKEE